MKRKLVDSNNEVIYEGTDAKDLLIVLLKEPENVTENDELVFEDKLRTLKWAGNLRFEVHFDLKFEGLDDWYRPIFKDVESDIRFGDVNKLFTWKEWEDGGMKHYKTNSGGLEYFGTSFDCEPNGGRAECWKLNILD